MKRMSGFALRALALAPVIAILLDPIAPAFGGTQRWRDDQIPFGPAGTIGRGTDSAADPPYNVRGGIPLFTFGRGYRSTDPSGFWADAPSVSHSYFSSAADEPSSARSVPGPYLTNQCHEPGDGYRYPVYYNPSTRTYFYYPAHR